MRGLWLTPGSEERARIDAPPRGSGLLQVGGEYTRGPLTVNHAPPRQTERTRSLDKQACAP